MEKLEGKVERMESVGARRAEGKENSLSNRDSSRSDEEMRKIGDYITREEMQRQLQGLDSAFRTLTSGMWSKLSTDSIELHAKNKRKLIDMMASQLNDKLEAFRTNFQKEWQAQIDSAKPREGREGREGVRRQLGGVALPLRLKEELSVLGQGVELLGVETTYYIDSSGFLLDSALTYILDKNSTPIQLPESQLQVLRKEGLLPAPH